MSKTLPRNPRARESKLPNGLCGLIVLESNTYSAIVGTQFISALNLHLRSPPDNDKPTASHLVPMKKEMTRIPRDHNKEGPHFQVFARTDRAQTPVKLSAVIETNIQKK